MLRTLLLCLLSLGLGAQGLQLAWWTQNDQVNIVDSKMDPWGNIVVAGTFTSIVDFDHGPHTRLDTAVGIYDMFLAKYDAYGNLLWVHSLGNNNPEKIKALEVDANGNIYAAGEFTRVMDFDPGPGVYNLSVVGYADIFLWSLKPNGDFNFARAYGDGSLESPNDISVNSSGDIVMTGFYWGTGDMDPTTGYAPLFNNGLSDIFVMRLSSAGTILWVRGFGAGDEDQGLNVKITDNKEIFLQGFFEDSVDFDPDTLSSAVYYLDEAQDGPGFFLHLSPQGTFKKAFASPLVPQKMVLNNNEELFFSGYFTGSKDFNPDTNATFTLNAVGAQTPYFVWKFDTAWTFDWAVHWGEAEIGKNSLSLSRDGSEGVMISAPYWGSIDLDPGNGIRSANAVGQSDIFVAQIDSAGQLNFGHSWGTPNRDYPALAMVNITGEIYVAGRFEGTMDMDPDTSISDLAQSFGLESFMLKLTYCQEVYGYDTIVACNSYTWINDFTYNDFSSGDRYIMESPAGCDSLVFLHLIMNFIDSSAYQLNDSTLSASQPIAQYQWIDCNTGLAMVSDTNRRFVPPSSGQYAVIISTADCIDTSACLNYWEPLSLEEATPLALSAYPNPSSGLVHLESALDLNGAQLFLSNMQGQIILQKELERGFNYQFKLPEQKGIYLLHLILENQKQSLRLIRK